MISKSLSENPACWGRGRDCYDLDFASFSRDNDGCQDLPMVIHIKTTALQALAAEQRKKFGRPLRVAIDTSTLEFQVRSARGVKNEATRMFYHRHEILHWLLSRSSCHLVEVTLDQDPFFKGTRPFGESPALKARAISLQLLQLGTKFCHRRRYLIASEIFFSGASDYKLLWGAKA